jgi:hypothetical protein
VSVSAFHQLTVWSSRKNVQIQSVKRISMEEIYRLDTRDKPRLLVAMMHALAAENGRISFEGKLSQTELAQMAGVASEESGVLKRATLQPKLDFLVLPLTSAAPTRRSGVKAAPHHLASTF